MTTLEIEAQLEQYAVQGGYPAQLFRAAGWRFEAREAADVVGVCLRAPTAAGVRHSPQRPIPKPPRQAAMIRAALELMRQAKGTNEPLRSFSTAAQLAAALEGAVDRAFPGDNYAFGYIYREAWTFQGQEHSEGLEVWLNFQFDGSTWRETSSHILPDALTDEELVGWTRTMMNEGFSRR